MPTAKEMFELMGFNIIKSVENEIIYQHRRSETSFVFYQDLMLYECIDPNDDRLISIQEHLAIHQQMKELGWIE